MEHLAGKSVIVTGAGRGIGAAIAKLAADAGAAVVVNDVDVDVAEGTVAEIRSRGGQAVAHVASVSDWSEAEGLIKRCVDEFGALDGLVNNAGIYDLCRPEELSEELLRRIIDVNLLGTAFCGAHAIRQMLAQGRGSIVNVTSGAQSGLPYLSAYGASKAGVAALIRSWATDLIGTGVRVNGLSPMAATRMSDTTARYLGNDVQGRTTLTPETNAPVAVYLLSDASQSVHGQTVRIQGHELSVMAPPTPSEPLVDPEGWTVDSVAAAFADGEGLGGAMFPLHPAEQLQLRIEGSPA